MKRFSTTYDSASVQHSGALSLGTPGFYTEYQIINYMGEPIFVQDANGVEQQIDAVYTIDGCRRIEILIRKNNGPRSTNHMVREIWEGNIEKLTINVHELDERPVYIRELNLLFYVSSTRIGTTHPQIGNDLVSSMDDVSQIVNNSFSEAVTSIVVNDPKNRLPGLYTSINGIVCCVVVNKDADQPECCQLFFRTSNGPNKFHQRIIEFDTIIDSNGVIDMPGNEKIYLATTKEKIQQVHEQERLEREALMTPEMLDQYKVKHAERHAQTMEDLKSDKTELGNQLKIVEEKHKQELQKKEVQIGDLKLDLEDKDKQLKKMTNRLELVQDQLDAALKLDDNTLKRERIRTHTVNEEAKRDTAELKLQKEETSLRGTQASTVSTVVKSAAIIVPIVATGLIWLMRTPAKEGVCMGLLSSKMATMAQVIRTAGSGVSSIISSIREYADDVCHNISSAVSGWFSQMAAMVC